MSSSAEYIQTAFGWKLPFLLLWNENITLIFLSHSLYISVPCSYVNYTQMGYHHCDLIIWGKRPCHLQDRLKHVAHSFLKHMHSVAIDLYICFLLFEIWSDYVNNTIQEFNVLPWRSFCLWARRVLLVLLTGMLSVSRSWATACRLRVFRFTWLARAVISWRLSSNTNIPVYLSCEMCLNSSSLYWFTFHCKQEYDHVILIEDG